MLRIEGLIAGYSAIPVLNGVSIKVEQGQFVAIVGPNGAGKSTLNNNLCGLYRPFGGTVRFEGNDITGARSTRIVEAGLVQVPEGRRIFPNLSVRENLELGSYRRGRADRQKNLDHVVAVFPRLKERWAQHAGTLSGGEQQMLAIGRGLMSEPRLLILDEPSLGLSPILVEDMFALIGRLNTQGLAILLVEQNVVQSLAIAHRAYVLEGGRVALSGKASELAEHPELRKSYLGH